MRIELLHHFCVCIIKNGSMLTARGLAMVTNFVPTESEIEDKEPGIGGKPPVDRRPTGGGGGGGDEGWNGHGGPRTLLDRVRLALLTLLTADLLFFVLLVSIRVGSATAAHPSQVQTGVVHFPVLLYLNAGVLLLSCLTMEVARRNIFREIDALEEWLGLGKPALRRALPWLAATLSLGLLCLAGQLSVARQIAAQGVVFAPLLTPAVNFYSLVAGIHIGHLSLGLLALIFCLSALGRLKRIELRQIAIDATAWFWHATALVWTVILVVGSFDH
jgi:cytochrome c oxidase subunit 3